MKKVLLTVLSSLILFLCMNTPASADNITIRGLAQFKCSLLERYMEKHGFTYIDEVLYDRQYKTNLFAAKNADVTIKNTNDEVVAHGKADNKGEFSFEVPDDSKYKIFVNFHGRKIKGITDDFKTNKYIADLGHFSSDEVGSWINLLPVTYCYSCDIRYLEAKGLL